MNSLIVFDLDGTLVDSKRDIADAANETLVAYGATPLSDEAIGLMVGNGAPVLVARAFAAAGREMPAGALGRFLACYDARLVKHTRPYDGIPALLAELAPRAELAVLTNKPLAATRGILDALGLSRYFRPDRIIGGDGALPRKPDPAGLRHLMELSGAVPASTVLVGDSVVDWRTAQAAGTGICLARYGFGWEGFPVEELTAETRIADRPSELRRLLATADS